MQCITDSTATLENREIAFDNLEQLVENLDNANNLENLKLWEPLVGQLDSTDKEMRFMAAWCVGTAVQNNEKSQANVGVFIPRNRRPLIRIYTDIIFWVKSSTRPEGSPN